MARMDIQARNPKTPHCFQRGVLILSKQLMGTRPMGELFDHPTLVGSVDHWQQFVQGRLRIAIEHPCVLFKEQRVFDA